MEIQVFNHAQFGQVRVTEKDGVPWFVGKDVALALGYKNPGDAVNVHVEDEDKMFEMMQNPSDTQNTYLWRKSKTTLINESGLFSLILSSKLDSAKAFKHWVTSEVLPQIRKTGGYVNLNGASTEEEIKKRVVDLYEKTIGNYKSQIAQLTAENRELAPKAWYSNEVIRVNRTYTVTEVAKALSMTVHGLTEMLLVNRILFRDQKNKLQMYAKYAGYNLMRIRTYCLKDVFGDPDVFTRMVFTEKGKYFVSLFVKFGLSHALKAVAPSSSPKGE